MKKYSANGCKLVRDKISVSVPGRICLFGEHQDYHGLPVITAAIDLRVVVTGTPSRYKFLNIGLPDINSRETLPLLEEGRLYAYEKERDYFKSSANALLKSGVKLKEGCDVQVRGKIPINSGASSSSALIVAWIKFLIELNQRHNETNDFTPRAIARFAHLAEVEEFGEPGGMMDHYATAMGGVLYITFHEGVDVTELDNRLGAFVLGDSMEPKDTKGVIHRLKTGVISAVEKIQPEYKSFNLLNSPVAIVEKYKSRLPTGQYDLLSGALLTRDITKVARKLLTGSGFDHAEFGRLLSAHHEILNKKLRISTPKIELMLEKAKQAGALGGKINGSGGGGCMFAYAPGNPGQVAEAIEQAGGKPYIINVGEGLKIGG